MADNKQSREVSEYGVRSSWCGKDDCRCGDYGVECRHRPAVTSAYPYDSFDNGIRVGINVDVSEALTGLKAVQREAKEATKALRELEGAESKTPEVVRPAMVFDKGPGKVVEVSAPIYDLTKVPTKQLHEELAKREGVVEYSVERPGNYAKLSISTENEGFTEFIEGPAYIIVNKD